MQLLQSVFFCNYRTFLQKKQSEIPTASYVEFALLFNDLQDLHRTCLNADATSNTLGSSTTFRSNHDLHGANLNTLTAGGAQLLVDHVNASLRILSDGTGLTNLSTLTALDAGHRLCAATLCNNTNAGKILIEFFVESVGASTDTLQTSHALYALLNGQLLHNGKSFLILLSYLLYRKQFKIAMGIYQEKTESSIFCLCNSS